MSTDNKSAPLAPAANDVGSHVDGASFWRLYLSAWAFGALVGIWWAYS